MRFEKLSWNDAKHYVKDVNPELFEIIEDIQVPDDCYLYRADYKYGDLVLSQGRFYYPNENGGTTLFDNSAPQEMLDDLSYNLMSNPVSLVLEGVMELYMTLQNKIVPGYLWKKGDLIGLSRILDMTTYSSSSQTGISVWDMTAGARSVFFLPKISNSKGHINLVREFDVTDDVPQTLEDQWSVISKIGSKSDWKLSLLFFSKKWFEKIKSKNWALFRMYLLDSNRISQRFWLNKYAWDVTFCRIHQTRNIKTASYGAEVVKNLYAIGSGSLCGFRPATTDEYLPLDLIQNVYVNIYGLRAYMPIVMEPAYFNGGEPVYQSLHIGSAEHGYEVSKIPSSLKLLENIAYLLTKHRSELIEGKLNVEVTPLDEIAKNVEFRCYHADSRSMNSVCPSSTLPEFDPRFICEKYKSNSEFPHWAKFFKGCFSISHKE